jgi:Fic family protein
MFLVAVAATAEKGKTTFQKILNLRSDAEMTLLTLGRRAKSGQRLLNLLYRRPTVNTHIVTKELKVSQVAADKLLKAFSEVGILEEITGFKRNRLFQFKRYFDLFLK